MSLTTSSTISIPKLGQRYVLSTVGLSAIILFDVVPTSAGHKFQDIHDQLAAHLPDDGSGAIVYCATRKQTEEIADFLKAKEFAAEAFHAKLKPETKKVVQESFISGQLRVIVATNAFGMGIDKSDVRLVIHADIPGSLENYLQEAGRAGNREAALRAPLQH